MLLQAYRIGVTVNSVSFDDDSNTDGLYVFSGQDLVTAHYDLMDLDWREVDERTAIDKRRGLVVLQVAVLEDLVDELILYLADPHDEAEMRLRLSRETLGPRITRLEDLLRECNLLDDAAAERIADLRNVTARRNELAHGTIHWRPASKPIKRALGFDVDMEWVIWSRRSHQTQRLTMAGLRADLDEAIGAFTATLSWAEALVEQAPRPAHFTTGSYISRPGQAADEPEQQGA